MNYRSFGHESVEVSEVGLGTWQLGSGDWGEVPERRAETILETALEEGINFFDTADVYGDGVSESRIGRFFAGRDETPFVATKAGRNPEPGWPENFEPDVMRGHVEASRERLDVDRIDLLQLHTIPLEELKRGTVFETLRELQAEGIIDRFGASVESMEEALYCLEVDGLSSLQIIFNVFRQRPAEQLFDRAAAEGVALIVRVPLASGLLAGKFSEEDEFPESDHRNYNRDGEVFNVGETFAGLPFRTGVRISRAIEAQVPPGMSMAQMALRWILDHEAVTTVIPGASRPEQVRHNAAASDLDPLSDGLHEWLTTLFEEQISPEIRGPR